jgi:all-trans-retinol 13,14-reductase
MKRANADIHVAVIGAGMAGLTAAAYLARVGYHVTVFEHFSKVGGATATLARDGYAWDLGPLMVEGFGPGERARRILDDLEIADRIALRPGDRDVVFPDFELRRPASYAGRDWRRKQLQHLFPAEGAHLTRYYQFHRRVMDLVILRTHADRQRWMEKGLLKLWMGWLYHRLGEKVDWSAARLMDHYFVDPRLKAVFTALLGDLVAPPNRFPALGLPPLNAARSFDARIPRRLSMAGRRPTYHFIEGGCGHLADAVAGTIRENGGSIYTNASVEQIVVEGDRVRGVKLAGGHFEPAEVVFASGGARETFFERVGRVYLPSSFAYQIDELEVMESVLMVQLGLDLDPTPYQPRPVTYYYGTYDIAAAIARCREGRYHGGADGFVIAIPSMHSPDLAPEGRHALNLYTIAPNELERGSWQSRGPRLVDRLLDHAERVIPGLRDHIETQIAMTPYDFRERFYQSHHAFGGCVPMLGQTGPGYETPIHGLWFIGAQSRSGGGIRNVMVGARDAVRTFEAARRHPSPRFI